MSILIKPGRAEKDYCRDLWRFRELFYILAWRDVAVRYKQTVIGITWAVIRPFLTMVIFAVIFGRIARLPSEGGAPYALMVITGILPWTFFSSALADASNSLINSASLISKVYFPRLIIPIATVVVALIDFLISFVILSAMLIWYRYPPDWRIVLLPLFVAEVFLVSLGPALWFAALNIKYRDFRHVIPFMIQLGIYASPVGFSSAVVPEHWRLLYSLNPMVGVIEGFRWCILGDQSPVYWPGFCLGLAVAATALWQGIRQFRKTEKSFADLL